MKHERKNKVKNDNKIRFYCPIYITAFEKNIAFITLVLRFSKNEKIFEILK